MAANKHGGKRPGAGRPAHPYKTKTIRVPIACIESVKMLVAAFKANAGIK